MTKKDLQQIRHLSSEIRILREHLREMDLQLGVGAISQDGMPKGNKIGRPVEDQAIRLAETCKLIQEQEIHLQELKLQAWAFVQSINDSLLRQIIILRFIDGKSWFKVSEAIGGDATADGCRMTFNRANIDD